MRSLYYLLILMSDHRSVYNECSLQTSIKVWSSSGNYPVCYGFKLYQTVWQTQIMLMDLQKTTQTPNTTTTYVWLDIKITLQTPPATKKSTTIRLRLWNSVYELKKQTEAELYQAQLSLKLSSHKVGSSQFFNS